MKTLLITLYLVVVVPAGVVWYVVWNVRWFRALSSDNPPNHHRRIKPIPERRVRSRG